jgi:hypothetical protein
MDTPKGLTPDVDTLRAAAVAGVLAFLDSEALDSEAGQRRRADLRPVPAAGVSPWALRGRRSIMQMRSLVQARILGRRMAGALGKRLQ